MKMTRDHRWKTLESNFIREITTNALYYKLEIPRIVHPIGYSPREVVDRDIMGQFHRNEGACPWSMVRI